ncbi:MAG TPA: ABC transporter permease [Candidatus Sulfotelmatobacter sp.]|nr:ABC transporter permease [Candidatus Sulfotelmatobacter sp.]
MTLWSRLRSWLRTILHRQRAEKEMDAELRFHLDAYAEDLIRAGIPREEAQRRARLEFGGLEQTKEHCRDATGANFLDSLLQDLRFGLRMLRKSPGFAAVAVATLALGIGANTAIFSVVNAVLLRPLAIVDPSRVVYIQEQWRDTLPGLSVGSFLDLKQQSSSFKDVCASNNGSFNFLTKDVPERLDGELVSTSYFSTFGISPIAGRVFDAAEDKPGQPQVVVISKRLWRTQFQNDRTILGQTISLNGLPYTVIGVMPQSFDPLLQNTDVWVPAAYNGQQIAARDPHYLSVVGRLKPGVQLSEAQSELNVIARRLQQQYPISDKDRDFQLTPLTTALLGDQRLTLQLLLAAVGFLLLIACANIANLQLARGRSRAKEIAVRAALGASTKRIVLQLLIENVVLGLTSGIVGVLFAYGGLWGIVAKGPANIPRLSQSTMDGAALVFACAVALISSFLFGLAPALRAASIQLTEAFKEHSGTGSGSRDRIRSVLVVTEIALALMLMAGAGLLIRSALLVSHVDPGFDANNLVAGRVGLSTPGYHDPAVARRTFENLVDAAAALPDVQSAAVVSRAPLAEGSSSNGVIPEGKAIDASNVTNALLQIVSPSYLQTARVPLKAGRDFNSQDTREKTLVAVVNETFARTLWPGENPIGKRFACCEVGPKGQLDPVWHEVVGVAGDVRARGLERQVQPAFYLPLAQMPPSAWDWVGRTMDLVVRTRTEVFATKELRGVVASVAPGIPIYQLSTMQQKIAGTLEQSHFDTFLLSLFAAIALLLSAVGIYGVLSYVVAQRTRDIGVRMALGATPGQVAAHVLRYGLRLIGAGVLIGVASALLCVRLLSSLLYGVRATDALTFCCASFVLAAIALLACYIPARRAAQVDPMVALRYE